MATQRGAEISEEELGDLIYDARVGDLDEVKAFFQRHDESVLSQLHDEFNGSTPLHMAAANGHVNVVSYLLSLVSKLSPEEAKSFINYQNRSGNTALHWAALTGNLEVVKLLSERGEIDPYIQNEAGHDCFFEAESNGKEDVIDYLLVKFSVEPDNDNEEGSSEAAPSNSNNNETAADEDSVMT